FLDEFIAHVDRALSRPTGDTHFLPLALPDALGASGPPLRLIPGNAARALAIACFLGAALTLILVVRRGQARVWMPPLVGAAAGLAFATPFVVGALVTGQSAPWRGPFLPYVLAGATCAAAMVSALSTSETVRREAFAARACAVSGVLVGLLLGG